MAGVVNPLDLLAAGLAAIAIFFHYDLRRLSSKASQIPKDYWWLGGVGGTIVAVLALASAIDDRNGLGLDLAGAIALSNLPNKN